MTCQRPRCRQCVRDSHLERLTCHLVLGLTLHCLVTWLTNASTPFSRILYKEKETEAEGVETHTTHLSYQISIFCVDQDHSSQPLKEGEGFVELRRDKGGLG